MLVPNSHRRIPKLSERDRKELRKESKNDREVRRKLLEKGRPESETVLAGPEKGLGPGRAGNAAAG